MDYQNLDLELFGHSVTEGGERFSVRVLDSPTGQQADAEVVTIDPDLRSQLLSLVEGLLDRAEMFALGEKLGSLLFPPSVRDYLVGSQAQLQDDSRLRVRLWIRSHSLAGLPWEYAYVVLPGTASSVKGMDGFLVLNRSFSLVRYTLIGEKPGSLNPVSDKSLRMVVLLASPENAAYPKLDLVAEKRRIEQALKDVPQIEPEFYLHATIGDLQDAFTREAHIFHFFGHGTFQAGSRDGADGEGGMGYLILEDKERGFHAFPAEDLILHLRESGVRLAVLSACEGARPDSVNPWSGVAPALMRAGIPAVVGMQHKIADVSAIAFSQRLYHTLAAGQSIDAAVTAGRLALSSNSREYGCDWGIPALYLRAEQGVLFPESTAGRPSSRPEPATAGRQAQRDVTVGRPHVEVDKRVLRTKLVQEFDLEELGALCADVEQALTDDGISLQVNLDMVGGSGKMGKVLGLIGYLDRRGYLGYLVEAARQARPNVEW